MTTFNINIPYTGNFTSSPGGNLQGQNWTSDLIYLGNDIFVGYVQQYNQGVGYIVVYEFNDLSNDLVFTNESLAHTNRKQQLLHVGDISGVKLIKIAENRVMVIVDRTVYILDFTGTDFVVSLIEQDFFVTGMKTRGNQINLSGRGSNYMATSVKENELLIVDNEVPAANLTVITQGDFKLYRVVYDPVGGTLTSTLKKDLTALIPAFEFPGAVVAPLFSGTIQRILGTNFIFVNFSNDISDTSTNTRNNQSIVYSARCDLEGNELEIYTAPTEDRTTLFGVSRAWDAIALRSDLIVYHHNMSVAQVLYQGDLYDTIPNGLLPEDTEINSAGPDMNFFPLDELHYLASWGSSTTEYTAVFKVDSPLLINTRASDQRGGLSIQRYSETPKSVTRLRNNTIQQYDSNTFILYTFMDDYAGNNPDKGPESNNEQYPFFRIRRISL